MNMVCPWFILDSICAVLHTALDPRYQRTRDKLMETQIHFTITPETKQDPMGLLGMEAFLCPPFLVCRKQSSASMTFPELQKSSSNSCYSGKGGDAKTREEQSRDNSAAFRQGPGSTSRDAQSNIIELFCRTKTPNKWKKKYTWWSVLHFREVTVW